MRKPELAAAIAEKADLTKEQANRVLNALLDEITGALNRKDSVTLVGFGTFLQRHRGARTGKNPQTGQPVEDQGQQHRRLQAGQGPARRGQLTAESPESERLRASSKTLPRSSKGQL